MKKRHGWMVAALVVFALGLGMTACGGGGGDKDGADTREPDNAAPADSTAVQAGAIYKANCVSCHGSDLGGGLGPELKNVESRLSEDQMFTVIKEGQGQMPAFGGSLSDEEIQALVEWVSAQ